MIAQQTYGKWDNIYHTDLSATPSGEWRRHYFSMTAQVDGPLRWWTNVGGERQTVEFGGMALVNLGPNVVQGLLRTNELNLNYAGRFVFESRAINCWSPTLSRPPRAV